MIPWKICLWTFLLVVANKFQSRYKKVGHNFHNTTDFDEQEVMETDPLSLTKLHFELTCVILLPICPKGRRVKIELKIKPCLRNCRVVCIDVLQQTVLCETPPFYLGLNVLKNGYQICGEDEDSRWQLLAEKGTKLVYNKHTCIFNEVLVEDVVYRKGHGIKYTEIQNNVVSTVANMEITANNTRGT